MNMVLVLVILRISFISTEDPPTDANIKPNSTKCPPEEYAFSVLIVKLGNLPQPEKICGGTLINARTVLTAASCLRLRDKLMVIAGMSNPFEKPELRNVMEQIPHLYYNRQQYKHDIAILILESLIPKSAYIDYARLPTKPTDLDEVVALCDKAVSVSWIQSSRKERSYHVSDITHLECAFPPVIAFHQCRILTRSPLMNEVNVCTLGLECQGLKGGPLLCGGRIFAVISWEVGCHTTYIAMHTRVDKNLDFVRLFLRNHRMLTNMGTSIYIGIAKWIYVYLLFFTLL